MKTVAEELREYGISANAIHPGGRVNVDGRGGTIAGRSRSTDPFPREPGQTRRDRENHKAKDWNEGRVQF